MSLCQHGIRIEHKRCDQCVDIAEAEMKLRDRIQDERDAEECECARQVQLQEETDA
jgi:hypothetical protein